MQVQDAPGGLIHRRPFSASVMEELRLAPSYGHSSFVLGAGKDNTRDANSSAASDSSEFTTIGASFSLKCPTKEALMQLCTSVQLQGTDHPLADPSVRLFTSISSAMHEVHQACDNGDPSACHRGVHDAFQDVHAAVVELDASLEETVAPGLLQDGRAWLNQVQGYALHVQRCLDDLRACEAGLPEWRLAYQEAGEALARVHDAIQAGGVTDEEASEQLTGGSHASMRSRRVAAKALLPYRSFWAGKVAL